MGQKQSSSNGRTDEAGLYYEIEFSYSDGSPTWPVCYAVGLAGPEIDQFVYEIIRLLEYSSNLTGVVISLKKWSNTHTEIRRLDQNLLLSAAEAICSGIVKRTDIRRLKTLEIRVKVDDPLLFVSVVLEVLRHYGLVPDKQDASSNGYASIINAKINEIMEAE